MLIKDSNSEYWNSASYTTYSVVGSGPYQVRFGSSGGPLFGSYATQADAQAALDEWAATIGIFSF